MNLVIFIGHHKVGSSSLQAFLGENYSRLRQAGILYPMIEDPAAWEKLDVVRSLATRKIFGKSPDSPGLPINRREPHNALAFRLIREFRQQQTPIPFHPNIPSSAVMLEIMQQQIREYSPHTTVLCSEVFATLADVSNEPIEWLKRSFPAASVRILCTLRRIDDYLCSWYGQRLKFGHQLKPLRTRGIAHFRGTVHFNYRKMLKAWLEVFPDAQFVIRNYADVLTAGGSIPDFITQSGLVFPPALSGGKNRNVSMPYCFYELRRLANFKLEPVLARQLGAQIESLAPSISYPENKRVELFGPATRQLVYEKFEPIHAFLSQLTGTTAFFPDQQDVLQTREIPEKIASLEAIRLLQPLLRASVDNHEIIDFVSEFEKGVFWEDDSSRGFG